MTEPRSALFSDLSSYPKWYASAKRSADAALDIYTERDDVERELALHLARSLRELAKRDAVDERIRERTDLGRV